MGVAFQFMRSTKESTFSPARPDHVIPVAESPSRPMKIQAPMVECRRVAFQRTERLGRCAVFAVALLLGRRRIHHI